MSNQDVDRESPPRPGDQDEPVGGRRLQLIALLVGIGAGLASIVGLIVSQSGGSASHSAASTNAAEVRACVADHHLSQQRPTIPEPAPSSFVLRSCAWPPPPGADQDGFTEISLTTVPGPGQDEASDATEIDRIVSPCSNIQLIYTNGSQGKSNFLKYTITVPTITSMDTAPEPWNGAADSLPFDPGPNEVDYVRSNDQGLSGASCV